MERSIPNFGNPYKKCYSAIYCKNNCAAYRRAVVCGLEMESDNSEFKINPIITNLAVGILAILSFSFTYLLDGANLAQQIHLKFWVFLFAFGLYYLLTHRFHWALPSKVNPRVQFFLHYAVLFGHSVFLFILTHALIRVSKDIIFWTNIGTLHIAVFFILTTLLLFAFIASLKPLDSLVNFKLDF